MPVLQAHAPDFLARLRAFVGNGEASTDVRATVAGIIADVRDRGDSAVLAYTKKFDRAQLSAKQLRIPEARLKQAAQQLAPAKRKAIDFSPRLRAASSSGSISSSRNRGKVLFRERREIRFGHCS